MGPLKKYILKIISPIVGKKEFHRFYELVYKFSLLGMNMGAGSIPQESGEKKVLQYLNEHFKSLNELTIFDVGANRGKYSVLVKEIMRDKAILYSFEPSLLTYQKLLATVNHLTKIRTYPFGFGDVNKKMVLFANQEGSGLASLYERKLDHLNIQMNMTEEVEIKTIDSFCRENQIGHIHFLKLDVEGNEKKVLDGASEMINSGAVSFIQFEFGGCNIDSRTYFMDFYYLLKDNFNIYRIMKNGLYPIAKYKEMDETIATTNYLAEWKSFH